MMDAGVAQKDQRQLDYCLTYTKMPDHPSLATEQHVAKFV